MKQFLLAAVVSGALVLPVVVALAQQTYDEKLPPSDLRYTKPKTLNDYFPFQPPKTSEEWERRREELRQQVLVANSLWPQPEKTPLHALIHGKIERDEYTIEKVFFASYPGHYVSGNLYRPKGKSGKLPVVLFAHGHWADGRLHDAGLATAKKQVEIGAEKTMESARYPLQAPCAMLARLGCIVFTYDMVGYADSRKIDHRVGFTDAQAELHLQSFMGLQTWNSVRALDFVLGLPDADPSRVAITGASGGGTQTFILGAIDDRLTAAFPAVMVSTSMQGGCVCENCSHLRVGTGNVELAGLFAPRPLGMSGAKDWTVDLETKGLPQLKALYKLYNAEDLVAGKVWPQFGHNYNQLAREMMYGWFNKHLKLGHAEPIAEQPFVPASLEDLHVYDDQHPLPPDAVGADELRKYLTESASKQLTALKPKDAASLVEYRRVYGTALRVMIGDKLPAADVVEEFGQQLVVGRNDYRITRTYLARKGTTQTVPIYHAHRNDSKFDGTVIVWVDSKGGASLGDKGSSAFLKSAVTQQKMMVLAVDPFLSGLGADNPPPPLDKNYAGFTFGYNRSILANRVSDILTAVAHARDHLKAKKIYLVGFDKAGPWVLLARALCGDAVDRCAADLDGFTFETITTTTDPNMLSGALKYGGLPSLAPLCAPAEVYVHNLPAGGLGDWLPAAYQAAGMPWRLQLAQERASDEKVLAWLMR
jgi:dienelactone hydrolase